MKAVVQDRYGSPGDVLQVREIAVPTAGDDDVLVRVRAASAHADVCTAMRCIEDTRIPGRIIPTP